MLYKGNDLIHLKVVEFVDEEGIDTGGLTRYFYSSNFPRVI